MTYIFDIFREDASPKVKIFIKFVLHGESQGHSGILKLVNDIAQELLKHILNDNNKEYKYTMRRAHQLSKTLSIVEFY